MLRRFFFLLAILLTAGLQTGAQAQRDRQPPYWASISAGQARMRTGPGENYPAVWMYVRRDLPIKVVGTQPNWRRVQDPEGATGWMLVRLLSEQRTALVTGNEPRPIYEEPADTSRVRYRAEPGVVGRISQCSAGWCRLDVSGRAGFIRTDHIWGVDPGEVVE
jgi:SH3-like domain-containing protein